MTSKTHFAATSLRNNDPTRGFKVSVGQGLNLKLVALQSLPIGSFVVHIKNPIG